MRLGIKSYQIAVAFFFVLAYVLTIKFVPRDELIYYSVLNCIVVSAFAVLAVFLGKPKVSHAPIWLVLYSLIIAYFLQFYILLYDPRIAGFDVWVDDFVADPVIVLKYFEAITVGFCGFCLASIVSIVFVRKKSSVYLQAFYSRDYFIALIGLILVLSFVSGSIMAIFGTSQMGGQAVVLPYRLSGIIYFIRVQVIPALIIYGIFIADKNERPKFLFMFLLLLVIHGLSDMVLRSSRGFLLQIVLMVTMLFVLSDRLNAARIRLLVGSIGFTIIAVPVIGLSREIRNLGGNGAISAVTKAITDVGYDVSTFFETMMNVTFFLLLRFTGSVSFLQVIGKEPERVLDRVFEAGFSVTNYMTYDVMGWPIDKAMGYAPSTFGYLYLLAGLSGVFFGMLVMMVSVMLVWSFLNNLNSFARPVLMAIFLAWFFVNLADGTWDGLVFRLFLLSLVMLFCEFITKIKFGTIGRVVG